MQHSNLERCDDHGNSIILFDGVCNLCNAFVRFVIRRDKDGVFRFGSLQSDSAQKLLESFESFSVDLTTIVLLEGDTITTESDAVLKIAAKLGRGWNLVSWFLIVPKSLRDDLYRFVSRHRYAIFGQRDSCMVPTRDLKDRFL